MRGNASRFPDRKQSHAAGLAAMKTMLCNARSLASFTPESLCRLYPVTAKEATYELQIARQKRERANGWIPHC